MPDKRQQVLDKLADFCLEQLENKNAPVAELELYLEHTRPDARKAPLLGSYGLTSDEQESVQAIHS